MIFTLLPHFLGVCCVLYALQLLFRLGQDFKSNRFVPNFVAFLGGIVAIFLAMAIILAVDCLLPVGSAATQATYFVRISFLIPLAYLAAFLASLILGAVLGNSAPSAVIVHITYLGVTLMVLAPVARIWLDMAARVLDGSL
ncbi:membrane hypothetical protein [uncultured delta proteobacterium]|uniref:Uncharacterized protein n=1 Tax=uncultured delta proteobacterium TaxID=34034 RepID=A0A212J0I8_9DELT|nr:membrane hypothetical protein [uncultured delta proteobacterium]